jgi:transcriptional regulator with XRE-family HTH domain
VEIVIDESMMAKLGAVMKNARLRAGKSRKELAEAMGVSVRHIMYIENGKQRPSGDLVFHIVRELYIPADLLFYPDEIRSQSFAQAVEMLRRCGDKEINAVISLLYSLLQDTPLTPPDSSREEVLYATHDKIAVSIR